MISIIISSPNKTKRQEYIQKYCYELSIDPLDITIIERETVAKPLKNSIGIEEIKFMQKKLFLKPIRSPTKAVIIEDAQLLTTEAQNAMLKVLEEPPAHTIIILSTESKEPLLPTIISRCKIIELEHEEQKLSENQIKELTEFIENLPKMPVGEKFKKAEQLSKDKDKTIEWTTSLILVLRERLLSCHSERPTGVETTPRSGEYPRGESHTTTLLSRNYLTQLKSFQNLNTLLKTTNVNPRFAIENTLLQLTQP